MVVFPNCKINLGLQVTGKRTDGYHNLETIFYPVPFTDALEVVRSGETSLEVTGLQVNTGADDNLCMKAYRLLQEKFKLPAVSIHLHKVIPTGAGLGGGSADAAFILKLLNTKFQLAIPENDLLDYALSLGSDCPFFIINKPAYATGRGEKLSPVAVDLSLYQFVLVNPGIHVSTATAFSLLTPATPEKSVLEVIERPVTAWKDSLKNDFEKSVFKRYPQIERIKDALYAAGAVYASMSGSGSTVYGLFKAGENPHLSFPPDFMVIRV